MSNFTKIPELPIISLATPLPEDLKEINNFKTTFLQRDADYVLVERECKRLITQFTSTNVITTTDPATNTISAIPINPVKLAALSMLYGLIRETRETMLENRLTYIQLFAWYQVNPVWAMYALTECVNVYGCWKDIRNLCDYCKWREPWKGLGHPFILFAIYLLENRLKEDWAHYCSGRNNWQYISYAAKWAPREGGRFHWLNEILCVTYYKFLDGINHVENVERAGKALRKSKMLMRKMLSTLNKSLDTLEIKQCSGKWNEINIKRVPVSALFKYHRSFLRHNVDVSTIGDNRTYSYFKIKQLTDKLNKDNDDSDNDECDIGDNGGEKKRIKATDYINHFQKLVTRCLGDFSGKYLGVLDISSLSKYELERSIGCVCVECDGVFVLQKDGKYPFVLLQGKTLCERARTINNIIDNVDGLDKEVSLQELKNENKIIDKPTTHNHLLAVCRFVEMCINETNEKTDCSNVGILVFSKYEGPDIKDIPTNFEFRLNNIL